MKNVKEFCARNDFPCWCGERLARLFCSQLFGRRHFVVLECNRCGTHRILPRAIVEQAAAETLYNEYAGTELFDIDSHQLFSTMSRRFSEVQLRFLPAAKVLDVGCGSGQLVEAICATHGCNGKGIDLDRRSIAKARAVSRHATFECGWFSPQKEGKKYDVVISSAVVEHVLDPVRFLQEHAEALDRGGSLFVSTPNASSLNYFVLRSWWRELLSIGEHIFLFSPQSLERCAREAGLTLVRASSDFDWAKNELSFGSVRSSVISVWACYRAVVKRTCSRIASPLRRDILFAHFRKE